MITFPDNARLLQIKNKVEDTIEKFKRGEMVLVGDDGKRENEVDLAFHAQFANEENVNFAITHAKGLLCVSVGSDIANRLNVLDSPTFPHTLAHTHFTLSLDAKNNIKSGVSASDRAHTIRLLGDANATPTDFVTPGHIFPVRAMPGGIFVRPGHTEALFELCQLAGLPAASVMCEVLDENGVPIPPKHIFKHARFSHFAYVTTSDLLWYKIYFAPQKEIISQFAFKPEQAFYEFQPSQATSPLFHRCAIAFHSPHWNPENVRICLSNGFTSRDNGVTKESCCAEVILFSFEEMQKKIEIPFEELCHMNSKEGLHNIHPGVKTFLTLHYAMQFLYHRYETKNPAQ